MGVERLMMDLLLVTEFMLFRRRSTSLRWPVSPTKIFKEHIILAVSVVALNNLVDFLDSLDELVGATIWVPKPNIGERGDG